MALAVHRWPGPLPRWGDEVLVISIDNGDDITREQARIGIRAAVREALAHSLGIALARLTVESSPGSAPRLLIDGAPSALGLSISHAGALSMAAINPAGAVGLDLMAVQAISDWARVAHDYLGMAAACRLAAKAAPDRPLALAQAWAAREARLKLHGLPLSEWAPLPDCRLSVLAAPPGFAAAIAL